MRPVKRFSTVFLLAGWLLCPVAHGDRPTDRYETEVDGKLVWVKKADFTTLELESLLPRSIAREAPAPMRQDMTGYGGAWSGHAQIFWRASAPQHEPTPVYPSLELPLGVDQADRYHLTLHYTAAPDYGTYNVIIGGELRAQVNGYASSVTRRSVRMDNVLLRSGDNQLIVAVHTKDPASTNYFVGLDRITLIRSEESATDSAQVMFDPEIQVGGVAAAWNTSVSLEASQVAPLGRALCITYVDFIVSNDAATASGIVTLAARFDPPIPSVANSQLLGAGWMVQQDQPRPSSTASTEIDPMASGKRLTRSLPLPLHAGRETSVRLSIEGGSSAAEMRVRPPVGCGT